MKGPQLLEEHVGLLTTRVGACFPGERAVFRGYDLHASLKDMGWLELYLFGITGRQFTPQQMKVLQATWLYTSYPDARLWNNRVAALASTTRSAASLGIAAALAVSDARIYGPSTSLRGIEFLLNTRFGIERGKALEDLVSAALRAGYIMGYGRPIISADERVEPMMVLISELGFDHGIHVQLAFSVEKILTGQNPALRLNFCGLAAALAADFGMSPQEYYLYMITALLAGMPPCYLDAAEKPEGQLFPLPCRMLSYEGVARRRWRTA